MKLRTGLFIVGYLAIAMVAFVVGVLFLIPAMRTLPFALNGVSCLLSRSLSLALAYTMRECS